MSWPAACNAASACSANSGVPAKTRRRKARSGRFAQLLGEARADALLLELGELLDEHLALEVIDLVLNADSKQSLRLQRKGVAVLVEGPNLYALRALDQLIYPGHRQAAFLDVGNAGGIDDLGIHQDHQRVAALGDIHHDHLLVNVH